MTTQPPTGLGFDPVTGQPLPPAPPVQEKKLLAPLWHTVLIVVVLLGNSFTTALLASRFIERQGGTITEKVRIAQYAFTVVFELFLLLLLWIGLRLRRSTIRELIGGRWATPEAFLLDIGIAAGFWLVAIGVLAGTGWAVGLMKSSQAEEARKLAEALAPHSWGGLMLFVALSTIAGFVEEIIFRGYLQRQIGVLTGNIYAGIVLSAAVFGGSHGYEGTRRMIVIFVYGMMFGFLALWRKSLRPGMMAHAWHDSLAGVTLFIVARKGFPSMR